MKGKRHVFIRKGSNLLTELQGIDSDIPLHLAEVKVKAKERF